MAFFVNPVLFGWHLMIGRLTYPPYQDAVSFICQELYVPPHGWSQNSSDSLGHMCTLSPSPDNVKKTLFTVFSSFV